MRSDLISANFLFFITISCKIIKGIWFLVKAHVYRSSNGSCVAFLSNYDKSSAAKVSFYNKRFKLPPWSISILQDCKNTIYNTASVKIKRIV